MEPPTSFRTALVILHRTSFQAWRTIWSSEAKVVGPPSAELVVISSCLLLTGLALLAFTVPVALYVVLSRDVFMHELLLFRLSNADRCFSHHCSSLAPLRLTKTDIWAIGLPLLTLTGATQVTTALLLSVGGVIRMAILGGGVYSGLTLTIWLSRQLSWIPNEPLSRLTTLRFGYVLLALYVSDIIPFTFAHTDLRRVKYEQFFSGLYGLFSGWLLVLGFPGSSAFLTGGLFLTLSLGMAAAFEKLVFFKLSFVAHLFPEFDHLDIWKRFERKPTDIKLVLAYADASLKNERGLSVLLCFILILFPFVAMALAGFLFGR